MRARMPSTEPSKSMGLAWEKRAEGLMEALTLGALPQSRPPSPVPKGFQDFCSASMAPRTSR